MPIVIKTKKVVSKCRRCYEIQEIKALGLKALPPEYLQGKGPHCYMSEGQLRFTYGKLDYLGHPVEETIEVGENIPELTFQWILKILDACGKRLERVNADLQASAWSGKEEFTI